VRRVIDDVNDSQEFILGPALAQEDPFASSKTLPELVAEEWPSAARKNLPAPSATSAVSLFPSKNLGRFRRRRHGGR
jgi:hypothetical protein